MIEVKEKELVESRCGISCSVCEFQKDGKCSGCQNITKPFWAETCMVKNCCESKELKCCGECFMFPCDLLKSYSYDENQGDNGLRIENCKKWCELE